MKTLASIQKHLEAAEADAALLTAAGEAFERIRAVADDHAVPGTPSFAAWSFVTVACSTGRNAVGHPPTAFPAELGGPEHRDLKQGGEDDAAQSVANLAQVLQRVLAQRAETAVVPQDQQSFRRAASAAADILDLMS